MLGIKVDLEKKCARFLPRKSVQEFVSQLCLLHIHMYIYARNVNGDKFLDCAPFYRMAHILGIPRLRSAFYRMRRFLECAEHIHTYMYTYIIESTSMYFESHTAM